ncbi:D-alanyl-D-alanine carboxypeptidase [Streptomyces sp. URMC 123]|uniref:D-alanyl-D-alanine carboxypeptidase n=1 Tax=Streptomyces sp. URMC 123 TaxID=3423403 RepID=UPI003F1D3F65
MAGESPDMLEQWSGLRSASGAGSGAGRPAARAGEGVAGGRDSGSGAVAADGGRDEGQPSGAAAEDDETDAAGSATGGSGAARQAADGHGPDSGLAVCDGAPAAAGKAGRAPASASAKAGDGEGARGSVEADGAGDDEAGQAAAAAGAEKAGAAGDGKGEQAPAKSSVSGDGKGDQATAVFGAVKTGAARDGRAGQDTAKPGAAGSDKGPEGEAKSGPKAASWGAGADGDGKPKEAAPLKAAVAASVAEDDSDDDGKVGSADQATQLIEAPKQEAAGSADQPTEPTKASAKPNCESESEHTSKFVALKKDDAPAPKRLKAAKPEAEPKAAPPAPAKPAAAPPAGSPDEPSDESSGESQAPLELLAQLTNTPPPPETPTRTAVRRVKIWTPLVVLLGILFVVVQVMRPLPAPKLTIAGKSSSVFEGTAPSLPWPTEGQAIVDVAGLGRVGSYGEMEPLPIGSVAKVMTTYIILRDHPLKKGEDGPQIDVDQKAEDDFTNGVREKESVVEVRKGQKISAKEAVEAVMLPSANNVARLLARWDGGTEEAFVKKMNDTARELGMTNTTYTDASGLLESTVSTAEDQVKLGKKAMQDPVFREISRATEYDSTTASGTGSGVEYQKKQRNFNKLVPMYGVVGIKTGSTTKAGGNLLFAAEKKIGGSTQLIIGAVFGQHKTPIIDTATDYSKQLVLAVGKALTTSTVVKKGEVVGHVDDGLGGKTPVTATKDLTAVGWPGLKVDLKLTAGGKPLPYTAKAGTQVGELTVGDGMGEVKVPVALQKDLAEPSFGTKLTRIS